METSGVFLCGRKPRFFDEDSQDLGQVVAALEDEAALGDDRVESLPAGECWIFHNAVEGHLAGAAEDGERCCLASKIHGVIAPFAFGDVHAVKI